MKAALMTDLNAPLKVSEVDKPHVGSNDVLVRVKACGVCYSDVKIWQGRSPVKPKLPHILGHEVAGVVAETGEATAGLNKGDPLIIYLYDTCDRCVACRNGLGNQCVSMGPLLGFNRPGGYAEYVSVPSKNVFKIPSKLDLSQAALIPDALITPYHAVVDKAQVKMGETAVLIGMGGLALHALQFLKLAGAKVIAVSRTESKLEMAEKLGADETVNSTGSNVVEEVKRFTDGYGADYVFDCVVTAETVKEALRSLRKGGKLVLLAYEQEPIPVSTLDMMLALAGIQSTRGGTRKNLKDLIGMVSEGKIKPVVTGTYSLDEASSALSLLSQGKVVGRIVLQP